MRVPENWLKDFITIKIRTEELARRITMQGLEVEEWTALLGEVGKLATAALWLSGDEARAKLLDACKHKGKAGRKATIKAANDRAEVAVRAAHRAWYSAMEGAHAATATPAA